MSTSTRRHFLFLATAIALVVGSYLWSAHAQESLSPQTLLTRLESGEPPLVLDVRTAGEYAAGHIPGALNIPHDQLEHRLETLTEWRHRDIVVHCQRGPRAGVALQILRNAGFSRLIELDGHMQRWQAEGKPLTGH